MGQGVGARSRRISLSSHAIRAAQSPLTPRSTTPPTSSCASAASPACSESSARQEASQCQAAPASALLWQLSAVVSFDGPCHPLAYGKLSACRKRPELAIALPCQIDCIYDGCGPHVSTDDYRCTTPATRAMQGSFDRASCPT